MPATYEPIATTTLSSAASSITFSSIPGTYTDLRVVFTGGHATTNNYMYILFNGTTGTTLYSNTMLYGDGSITASSRETSATRAQIGYYNLTTPSLVTVDIFNYAGSTNKTYLSESSADNNGSGNVLRFVGLWRNTAAITSLAIQTTSGNFNTGTTATLYGILKA